VQGRVGAIVEDNVLSEIVLGFEKSTVSLWSDIIVFGQRCVARCQRRRLLLQDRSAEFLVMTQSL
jgi:hypothetical protein